jgi:hypothetical protein
VGARIKGHVSGIQIDKGIFVIDTDYISFFSAEMIKSFENDKNVKIYFYSLKTNTSTSVLTM